MLTFQLNSFNSTIFWYLSTFTLQSCFPAQHLSPTHPSPVSLSCVALLTLLIGCGFIHRPVEQSDLALTANLSGVLSDEAVWSGRGPVCYVCIRQIDPVHLCAAEVIYPILDEFRNTHTSHTYSKGLCCSKISLFTGVQSVWLNVCISILPSLASYMLGTGKGSPALLLPDLASAPLPSRGDGAMVEEVEGGIEPDYVAE